MSKRKQLKQEEKYLKQAINCSMVPEERDYFIEKLGYIQEEQKKQKNKTTILIIMIILGLTVSGIFVMGKINEKSEKSVNNDWDYCDGCRYSNPNGPLDSHSHIHIDKPIIYLYPEKEMEVTVKLGNPEKLTCTYPKYDEDGWTVIAKPDGKLVDTETDRNLYSLYWEGEGTTDYNLNEGFVVKGEDSIKFLEEKLEILGLNEYEAEEFIVYWLPKLEANEYNFIRFATMDEINKYMPLEVSGNPDSIIRVLMQFKPLDKPIEIKEQKLTTPERTGFTVVEWGGTEIK